MHGRYSGSRSGTEGFRSGYSGAGGFRSGYAGTGGTGSRYDDDESRRIQQEKADCLECGIELLARNIQNKSSYHKSLLKYHPDKSGDVVDVDRDDIKYYEDSFGKIDRCFKKFYKHNDLKSGESPCDPNMISGIKGNYKNKESINHRIYEIQNNASEQKLFAKIHEKERKEIERRNLSGERKRKNLSEERKRKNLSEERKERERRNLSERMKERKSEASIKQKQADDEYENNQERIKHKISEERKERERRNLSERMKERKSEASIKQKQADDEYENNQERIKHKISEERKERERRNLSERMKERKSEASIKQKQADDEYENNQERIKHKINSQAATKIQSIIRRSQSIKKRKVLEEQKKIKIERPIIMSKQYDNLMKDVIKSAKNKNKRNLSYQSNARKMAEIAVEAANVGKNKNKNIVLSPRKNIRKRKRSSESISALLEKMTVGEKKSPKRKKRK